MKFLLDAHLPPSLRQVFTAAGHHAIHTLDLPDQNASPPDLADLFPHPRELVRDFS